MKTDIAKPLLVVPNGKAITYFPKAEALTQEDVGSTQERFDVMARNISQFYDLVEEGALLAKILGTTSYRSFMDKTLARVRDNASFRNTMAEILHGHDTESRTMIAHLPWLTIYADFFTSTPIPENIEAIGRANRTLDGIVELIKADRKFYDEVRTSVRMPDLHGEKIGVDGLECTIFGDEQAANPRMISAESSIIVDGDRTYYNGLPADRARFPTVALAEGSRVSINVKNTSSNRVYAVVPTINGIPLRLAHVGFRYLDFEQTPFPLTNIVPEIKYLKPGEEFNFKEFFVNRTVITGSHDLSDSYPSAISEQSAERNGLSFRMDGPFRRKLGENEQRILQSITDPVLAQQVLYESRVYFVHEFMKSLERAKACAVYVSKPEIADSRASSQLDNPFLGSIGLMVLGVTAPPVTPRHDHSVQYLTTRGGEGTKSMGMAGLAHISGGADRRGESTNPLSSWKFDSGIHKVVGYVSLNLMSLR